MSDVTEGEPETEVGKLTQEELEAEFAHRSPIISPPRFRWNNVGPVLALVLLLLGAAGFYLQQLRVDEAQSQEDQERAERLEAQEDIRDAQEVAANLASQLASATATAADLNAQLAAAIAQIGQLGGDPVVSGTANPPSFGTTTTTRPPSRPPSESPPPTREPSPPPPPPDEPPDDEPPEDPPDEPPDDDPVPCVTIPLLRPKC